MRIIKSSLENGVIDVRLLIEYDDIIMAAGQQQAVQQAIVSLSESLGVSDVHYASIKEMDEKDNGDVEICLEAAVSPVVTLGKYKGLEIEIGHNEDFEKAALKAATDNISVDIPALIIDRQLDSIENQAHSELLQSTTLHTLADIYSIISRLNKQLKSEKSEDETWKQAMSASESYIDKNVQDVDLMVEAIKAVCDAPEDRIFRGIVTRAQERGKMDADTIAKQVFDAYLRTQDSSLEQWREDHREEAEFRCRQELMLKAVVKAEGIEANEVEVQRAACELAYAYGMDTADFLSLVGEDGLRAQLAQQMAVDLIVQTAKNQ